MQVSIYTQMNFFSLKKKKSTKHVLGINTRYKMPKKTQKNQKLKNRELSQRTINGRDRAAALLRFDEAELLILKILIETTELKPGGSVRDRPANRDPHLLH